QTPTNILRLPGGRVLGGGRRRRGGAFAGGGVGLQQQRADALAELLELRLGLVPFGGAGVQLGLQLVALLGDGGLLLLQLLLDLDAQLLGLGELLADLVAGGGEGLAVLLQLGHLALERLDALGVGARMGRPLGAAPEAQRGHHQDYQGLIGTGHDLFAPRCWANNRRRYRPTASPAEMIKSSKVKPGPWPAQEATRVPLAPSAQLVRSVTNYVGRRVRGTLSRFGGKSRRPPLYTLSCP